MYLSTNLSNCELLNASSLPFLPINPATLPAPYAKGATNTPSAKNFALFSNLRKASSSVSVLASLSKAVGLSSNISPKVPISSMS